MLDDSKIHDIAAKVAQHNLGTHFKSVISSSSMDSMGRDAIRIEIFLTPGSSASITGQMATTTVYDLNRSLQEAGEERLPIVRWFERSAT
jgi:hypothetical protein